MEKRIAKMKTSGVCKHCGAKITKVLSDNAKDAYFVRFACGRGVYVTARPSGKLSAEDNFMCPRRWEVKDGR